MTPQTRLYDCQDAVYEPRDGIYDPKTRLYDFQDAIYDPRDAICDPQEAIYYPQDEIQSPVMNGNIRLTKKSPFEREFMYLIVTFRCRELFYFLLNGFLGRLKENQKTRSKATFEGFDALTTVAKKARTS